MVKLDLGLGSWGPWATFRGHAQEQVFPLLSPARPAAGASPAQQEEEL